MERSDEKCALMTEEEAREVLREFMEKPDKGKEWPKVWIGEKIMECSLGYGFQAAYYFKGQNPEDHWCNWIVDAKTRDCGYAIM